MQRIKLAPDYEISRVIRGGWQLAAGHGQLKSDDPVADMVAFADAGITTFDCADIYTGVEELIGRFRLRYRELRGEDALARIKVHTKFVPDLEMLKRITKSYVESVIDQSLRRLKLERLDLVQFHWWDYEAPTVAGDRRLAGTSCRLAGKIHKVSATNFDTDRMLHMVRRRRAADLDAGAVFAARQPAGQTHGRGRDRANGVVACFCYGTVAGGFLGDRWLGAAGAGGFREPLADQIQADHRRNRRLGFFQALLKALRGIADRHGVDIATDRQRRHAAQEGGGGGHRRRAQPRPTLHSNLAISDVSADRQGPCRDRRRAGPGQGARRRRLHAGARPLRPPRLRS